MVDFYEFASLAAKLAPIPVTTIIISLIPSLLLQQCKSVFTCPACPDFVEGASVATLVSVVEPAEGAK